MFIARKSKTISWVLIVLLLVPTMLSLVSCDYSNTGNAITNERDELNRVLGVFQEIIERESPDGLRLEILHCPTNTLCILAGFTMAALLFSENTERYEVDGAQLAKHIETLRELNSDGLNPVEKPSDIHAILCYVFFWEDKPILQVAFYGNNLSIYIEGVEVDYDERFTDLLKPFVPEDIVNEVIKK